MTAQDDILDYLRRAKARDDAPGGSALGGLRSTREVADATGTSMSNARRYLHTLHEAGVVEAFDRGASGTMGNPIDWRIV